MKLNKSGIEKVVNYIGNDRCRYASVDGRHLMIGVMTSEDEKMLEDIGIKVNKVGKLLYEVDLDEPNIDNPEVDVDVDKEVDEMPKDIKDMAQKLLPYLSEIFPTKDEINEILKTMQAQMIDPDEMIDGLKMQIRRIQKQSRDTDEVG